MKLEDLGYTNELEEYRKDNNLLSFEAGRIVSEHKERYVVRTCESEYDAEIIGNLRYTAPNRTDFPAVGDWVAISGYDRNKMLIHAVLPRKTVIERQAVGRHGEKQIIASNVDYALIIQSVDRDFNINRLERYLTICYNAKIKPVIILNKIDLIDGSELKNLTETVRKRTGSIPLLTLSNESKEGFDDLKNLFEKGKTYCLLGSSGVGKSTLVNNLSGRQLMKTDKISNSTSKGRHVTSHREVIFLENGGILIDNPGMREVGITDSSTGLEMTFDKIIEASMKCRFNNCTHTKESGCAVLELVEKGEIDPDSYDNYVKLEREKSHFELNIAEKRKKEKEFGKMVKNFKKDIQKISAKHNNSSKK